MINGAAKKIINPWRHLSKYRSTHPYHLQPVSISWDSPFKFILFAAVTGLCLYPNNFLKILEEKAKRRLYRKTLQVWNNNSSWTAWIGSLSLAIVKFNFLLKSILFLDIGNISPLELEVGGRGLDFVYTRPHGSLVIVVLMPLSYHCPGLFMAFTSWLFCLISLLFSKGRQITVFLSWLSCQGYPVFCCVGWPVITVPYPKKRIRNYFPPPESGIVINF